MELESSALREVVGMNNAHAAAGTRQPLLLGLMACLFPFVLFYISFVLQYGENTLVKGEFVEFNIPSTTREETSGYSPYNQQTKGINCVRQASHEPVETFIHQNLPQ